MFAHTRRRALGAAGASLITVAIVAGGEATSGQAPQRTPVAPVFNGVLFEEHVRSTLSGIVKGYAFAVADRNGAIQAKAAGGWAQDPSDGNVRMTTDIATAIGSVTKVMSGAALLHLFERHALASTSVDAQLDMKMLSKLPEKWQFQWRGRNLERISYRHLLQHKSGFRDASCDGKALEPLDQLAAGVKIEDVGKLRCYNNFNYYLMRYLIASIAYPHETAAIHKKYESLSLEDYTEKVNIEFSQQYERFMRDEFLPRSLDRLLATCRPQKDLPARASAKGYSSKDDKKGAFLQTLDWERSAESYCPSQGSWYLSAESLALFGRNLLYTDRWVSPATRRLMFDPADSGDEFPWAGTVRNNDFGQEMGQSVWPSHGGSQNGYKAALVQLPYGYVGAALINSADRESDQIAKTLMDAFYAGTRGKPISRAKHGMTPSAYQAYVSELDESAHTIDWVDFYNVGHQVFVNVIVRPAGTRGKNYVRHGLTAAQYQQEVDEQVVRGRRRLLLVDSYLDRGQVRYACIMTAGDGKDLPAYHGADAAQHKKLFDTYTSRGFVPTSVSVVSVNGERSFSTSWERGRPNGLMVRSTVDGREYQQLANDMAARHMALTYLNTYVHQGEVQYSAVFVGGAGREQEWRHGMTSDEYQAEFDKLTGKGLGLRLITGAGAGSAHVFAAVWER
jgi:Beta-lactamase/Polyglycine hydrolase-like, structural repeat